MLVKKIIFIILSSNDFFLISWLHLSQCCSPYLYYFRQRTIKTAGTMFPHLVLITMYLTFINRFNRKSGSTFLGRPSKHNSLSNSITIFLQSHGYEDSKIYERFFTGSEVYYSKSYRRQLKRNSTVIQYTTTSDRNFGAILCFISHKAEQLALIQQFTCLSESLCFDEMIVEGKVLQRILIENSFVVVPVCSIVCKCVFVQTEHFMYVCVSPNRLKID